MRYFRPKKRPERQPLYRGPNRGHNRPVDVLAFIETRLVISEAQPDPIKLAKRLGYDDEAIANLQENHGDKLLGHLQKVERSRADTDRFLAKQQGRDHPEQYASTHHDAVDELPTIPERYEERLGDARLERANFLLAAMVDTEAALKARLDSVKGTYVEGEIRRAYVQARRAREKAEITVRSYELDRAA